MSSQPHKFIDHVVVDVEIQKTIEGTPRGWDATDKLGVSIAVIYEFLTDRFRIYGPTDAEQSALKRRLLKADRISGFNIWKFDFPVIWGVPARQAPPELLPKTNDILRRIWLGLGLSADEFSDLHKGWGLDVVSKNTFKAPGKIANGAQAPHWFQAGEWGPLTNYCVDDVTLERDLIIFCDRYGYVTNGQEIVQLGPEGV
jgi:hypothetical protein